MSRWADHGSECQISHGQKTPLLLQAMERHEQGLLPRPMRLWLRSPVLELGQEPGSAPLRPHG